MTTSSVRVPLTLCKQADAALIRAITGNNRSKIGVYGSFLNKAEIIIRYTRMKSEDFNDRGFEKQGPFTRKLSLSPKNHPLLYRIYCNSPYAIKTAVVTNVLRRCAEFLEENPDSFEVLASQLTLGQNSDLSTESREDDALIDQTIQDSIGQFDADIHNEDDLPLPDVQMEYLEESEGSDSTEEEASDTLMMEVVDDFSEIL